MPASPADRVTGFAWCDPAADHQMLGSAWSGFFASQTLPEAPPEDEDAYRVLSAALPDAVPRCLTRTLLEEMAWALVCRPTCDAIVHPLYVSLVPDRPQTLRSCMPEGVERVLASGFLALCRPDAAGRLAQWASSAQGGRRLAHAPDLSLQVLSRALLEERA